MYLLSRSLKQTRCSGTCSAQHQHTPRRHHSKVILNGRRGIERRGRVPYLLPTTVSVRHSLYSLSPNLTNFLVRHCRSRQSHRLPHLDRGTFLIIVLATYCTIFSGIWLGVAIAKPSYGTYVMNGGRLAPSTASILVAGFAKTIELSFVAVFIAYLGQYLSRRALSARRTGITIADMQLRTLILQPGALFIHFSAFLGSFRTWMGALATLATISAIFYTTASDALVAPKLKLQNAVYGQLTSLTQSGYADSTFVHNQCPTPISGSSDVRAGIICSELEHSGQAYHNFLQYLMLFNQSVASQNVSTTDMAGRPPPIGMLFDNTTAEGIWAKPIDMAAASKDHNRTINNVTMIFPHGGLFGATKLADNDLAQPSLDVRLPRRWGRILADRS